METHIPGDFPVTQIECVGHCDRDQAKGTAFENKISEDRAAAVMEKLKSDIFWHDPAKFLVIRGVVTPLPQRIEFLPPRCEHAPKIDPSNSAFNPLT
ncbi:MAG: hypothetical protein DCF30_09315 [Hyphomicrobiales bacterium]|nr:MAG: hypothetical protein DCF30_09315 [Hyphomicrobiales bacterium]